MSGTLRIAVFFFIALTLIHAQKPFVLGVIDTVPSKILNEKRVVNIYLPEGYSPDSAARYPVIYLLDGSDDEDFIHIVGLVQFCNFPWVKILPNSIVVGIANVDRKRDFTYPTTIGRDKKDFPTTGGSEKFISFIENELQPFVEKHYKTNSNKMLIGQSLGGLLAVEILFKKPQLFTQYAIVSPSLWWDKESLLRLPPKVLQSDYTTSTKIYIAVGKEGDTMENDAKNLHQLLQNAHRDNLKLNFQYFPDENHATIYHQAIYKAFEGFK